MYPATAASHANHCYAWLLNIALMLDIIWVYLFSFYVVGWTTESESEALAKLSMLWSSDNLIFFPKDLNKTAQLRLVYFLLSFCVLPAILLRLLALRNFFYQPLDQLSLVEWIFCSLICWVLEKKLLQSFNYFKFTRFRFELLLQIHSILLRSFYFFRYIAIL